MMYHCVLQEQNIPFISAASTAFILCIAMFVTKAFSLDCPYNTYIMINMIISVISAALESSSLGLSKLCSLLSRIFFLFLYPTAKSHSVLGALIKFGLISNVSSDIGRICSCFVQFNEICLPKLSKISSK